MSKYLLIFILSLLSYSCSYGELTPNVPSLSYNQALKGSHPVVKLEVSLEDLFGKHGILFFDPVKGIDNRIHSGREQERPARLSIVEREKVVYQSDLGVRLHGGASRKAEDPSFRVYARSEYDSKKIKSKILFGGKIKKIKRLIIHRANDFVTFTTSKIINRLEGLTPESQASLFFLNDQFMGIYFLSEHLNPKHWKQHLNSPEDFYFVRSKSAYTPDDDEYEGFLKFKSLKDQWLMNVSSKDLYEEAKNLFDMKNFFQHMLIFAFLGTTDWAQGAALKDGVKGNRPWKFVSWDLEHSIFDYAIRAQNDSIDLSRAAWAQESFELIMTERRFHTNNPLKKVRKIKHHDLRRVLFNRLWFESLEFRKNFTDYTKKVFKNRLSQEYLDSLYEENKSLAKELTFGKIKDFPEVKNYLDILKDFFSCRRHVVLQRLAEINKFPLVSWTKKSQNETLDSYRFFSKINEQLSCDVQ